jgi:hypothetical protein
MKNHFFFYLFLIFTNTKLTAQFDYAVKNISPDLLKNAKVVIRKYEVIFEILNKKQAIETEHKVITILKKTNGEYEEIVFPYSKFQKIEDIEAAVFDKNGKLLRKLKQKDISDQKSLEYDVNDSRYKLLNLPASEYPYTIEYTLKTRHEGLMFYPVFMPQNRNYEAVESAYFEIKMPERELVLRIKEIEVPKECKIGEYTWKFKNIVASKPEEYSPISNLNFTTVMTAPTDFTFGGFDGNMSTWENFGQFIHLINKTQTELPVESSLKIKKLVADCPDIPCKVDRIYAYLQENTRYFYVGLGIGGWQPSPASKVDQYKYGDCKGLSNYLVAMLKAVDVPAYYVLICAGKDEQFRQKKDFPSAWFNHAIACVPNGLDTIWLECTSQTESCGFMSNFTDNRAALIITPEGGKLVQTPKYDENDNVLKKTDLVQLSADGSANLHSKYVYRGIEQNIVAELAEISEDIRKKYIYQSLEIKDFEIKELSFKREKSKLPSVEQKMNLFLPQFGSLNGNRMFIPICIGTKPMSIPSIEEERKYDLQVNSRGKTEESELIIPIPDGFRLESEFPSMSIKSDFGSLDLKISINTKREIVINRRVILNNSIQPKEKYGEFIGFLKAISKADKTKLVLIKGT